MGFGKIAALQIQQLAGMADAGAMDRDYARQAAEQTLSNLNDADRREAEAVLRQNAPGR